MGRYERYAETERLFEKYCSDDKSGGKVAKGYALMELGQRWDYLITLRLPRGDSDRDLLTAAQRWLLMLERPIHRKNANERLRCSVYLHRDSSVYHAHIYIKTPLCYRDAKNAWERHMQCAWYLLDKMSGHDPRDLNADFYYDIAVRESLTLAFGFYGIKQNIGYTAWIEDLSRLIYGEKKSIREGKSILALAEKYSAPTSP